VKVVAIGVCTVSRLGDSLVFEIGDVVFNLDSGMPVVIQVAEDRVVVIFQSSEEGVMLGLATTSMEKGAELQKLLEEMKFFQPSAREDEKKEELVEVSRESRVARYGNKLASVISKGGKLGLDVIDRGTEKVKSGIHVATEKAKERLPQKEVPTQISESTKAKVEKAKMASTMAVNVSSAMIKGAMEAVNQMSDSLKPVLNEYLDKTGMKSDKPAGPKTKATINVGRQSLKAALEIYLAMREASVALMSASLDATAELIEHRYGNEAGGLAKDASYTAKNALELTKNLGGLGVKKVAKKLVVDTVLKSVEDTDVQCEPGAVANNSSDDPNAVVHNPSAASLADISLPVRRGSSVFDMD